MISPQTALHDPVFRAYLLIVPVSLTVGGAILGFLDWGLKKELGVIWKTYRSWLVMASIGLMFVFAGRIPVIVGVTLLSIFGFNEFARSSGLYRDWWMTGAVSLSIVGFIYIGWMFGHLGFLANATNAYGFLCYVIFSTALSDVSAFTFGRLFGRHPLRSEISPNKTWEGALGALGVSMVLPWLLRFSFPFFGATQLILTGLIIGVGGMLGDLSVSLIKRDIGTKDMGAAIPGHGGILDRIDSLIYVAPLFMHMTRYYYP